MWLCLLYASARKIEISLCHLPAENSNPQTAHSVLNGHIVPISQEKSVSAFSSSLLFLLSGLFFFCCCCCCCCFFGCVAFALPDLPHSAQSPTSPTPFPLLFLCLSFFDTPFFPPSTSNQTNPQRRPHNTHHNSEVCGSFISCMSVCLFVLCSFPHTRLIHSHLTLALTHTHTHSPSRPHLTAADGGL